MPAALTAAPEDDDLRQQLDQLIPPSTGSGLRLLVSTLVVAAAIGFLVLNIGGYLYPRPTFGASFGGNTLLQGDRDRGLVAAEIALPNYSQRSIRVTDVILEAPGAELVEVGLRLDEPIGDEVTTVASGLESVSEGATSIDLSRPASATPLPATIPPGRTAWLVLWFRPLECTDGSAPWGIAEATVDFGAEAFPPFDKSIRIDQDPIAEPGETMSLLIDGDMITADGPLAAACEALR